MSTRDLQGLAEQSGRQTHWEDDLTITRSWEEPLPLHLLDSETKKGSNAW
jgi:hypothetical protein